MGIKSYQDLEVWQKAMQFVTDCYRVTGEFPKSELYGLTNQMRRAAVSIPSNIAEGQARQYTKEFIQFLAIASGSLAEVETQLLISVRLGYLQEASAGELLESAGSIGRMLRALRKSLEARQKVIGGE